jgi:hypothetical protein
MVQGGVIAVYTKNNFLANYVGNSPNLLTIDGLPEEDLNGTSGSYSEAPDLDPLIFWKADLSTNQNGQARLSFKTNNVTGTCLIQVVGKDTEGRLLESKLVYEVSGR